MLTKYEGAGCYRFIDKLDNIIYIGSSKSIHKRLRQHFGGKQGHLGSMVYDQVARVEICKCEDYPTALALENVLISKYRPKFNRKDKSHNINFKATKNSQFYEKLENWQLYYKFKELDTDKIKMNTFQEAVLMLGAFGIFMYAILGFIL